MHLPDIPNLFPQFPTLSSLIDALVYVITWLLGLPAIGTVITLTIGLTVLLTIAGFLVRLINPSVNIGGQDIFMSDIAAYVKAYRAIRGVIRRWDD